jgi:hypothetical protein
MMTIHALSAVENPCPLLFFSETGLAQSGKPNGIH